MLFSLKLEKTALLAIEESFDIVENTHVISKCQLASFKFQIQGAIHLNLTYIDVLCCSFHFLSCYQKSSNKQHYVLFVVLYLILNTIACL